MEKIMKSLEKVKENDVCKGMSCAECEHRYHSNDCDKNVQKLVVDKCKEIVQEAAKAYAPVYCNERLPEESLNSVLGWDEFRERWCFVQYLQGRFILGNDTDTVKITAWMPVPDAPQRKGR